MTMADKHKERVTPEYCSWKHMRQRCFNPLNVNYKHYGGRGIKPCKRWNVFKNFLSDMGSRPAKGYTIERRNNNKGYTPNNCYWATRKDQGRNTRSVKLTRDEIRQIKVLLHYKIPQTTLSRVYCISRQTVSAINCKRIWV